MTRDSGSYQFLSETLHRWSRASLSDDAKPSDSDSRALCDTDREAAIPEFGGFSQNKDFLEGARNEPLRTRKDFERQRLAFVEDPRFAATLAPRTRTRKQTPMLGQPRQAVAAAPVVVVAAPAPAPAPGFALAATLTPAQAQAPAQIIANPKGTTGLATAATVFAAHQSPVLIPPPPPRPSAPQFGMMAMTPMTPMTPRHTTGQFGVVMSHEIPTVPPSSSPSPSSPSMSMAMSVRPPASPQAELLAKLAQLRAMAAKIPLPIFFPVGAMAGILFAMMVVIATRSPATSPTVGSSTSFAPVAVSTPAQPAIEGARSLMIATPIMVMEKSAATATSSDEEGPTLMTTTTTTPTAAAPPAAPASHPRAAQHRAPPARGPVTTRRAAAPPAAKNAAAPNVSGNLLAAAL